ncbi:MAG TPA: alanine racemase, partial [Vicinamibacterales bacterium]|nr:alanine racemase [Vicinamibacterales bacterium]
MIGASKWDLDTPALCVDIDALDRNIAAMQRALAPTGVASRPHAKTHKCAAIAARQLAAGAVGLSCAKVSEAEALWNAGVAPLMMTTSSATLQKMRRAMALRAANPLFVQAVDHEQGARGLDAVAQAAGVVADVVVDVAVGTRSGVPPGDPAVALAQTVDRLPHLKLRGLLSYDGSAQHVKGFAARRDYTLKRFEASVATFERMKKSGLNTEIFSCGGTGTYNILSKVDGVTDVQVGSYIFMDAQYLEIGGDGRDDRFADFEPSLTVLATIVNAYFPGRLTTDAGSKALTTFSPGPFVVGEPGFAYDAGSDEFGMIEFRTSNRTYAVGDTIEMIVPHCDPVVNL